MSGYALNEDGREIANMGIAAEQVFEPATKDDEYAGAVLGATFRDCNSKTIPYQFVVKSIW